MNKNISILPIILLSLVLTACGGNDNEDSASTLPTVVDTDNELNLDLA
jgi:outer membrane PBP1 activator LpoA protein